ncbi:expressed unknown protein [Seminavis robusta]|uniref:Uncharacterized protein n=1 Tax=Seminavis robusta TaxID=568900 RepID=A0A9N8EMD8_9STRA|nr:expressed unknown protein [Seminavis robusta]|eukprot:Sro1331_g263550.1 n/a (118) ;mRNA; r:27742-28095
MTAPSSVLSENQHPMTFHPTPPATGWMTEKASRPLQEAKPQQQMRVSRKRSSSNENDSHHHQPQEQQWIAAQPLHDYNTTSAPNKRRRGLTDATTATINHPFPATTMTNSTFYWRSN